MFAVWDRTNDRDTMTFSLDGKPTAPERFADRAAAEQWAAQLNDFGGYGGWNIERFVVREVFQPAGC